MTQKCFNKSECCSSVFHHRCNIALVPESFDNRTGNKFSCQIFPGIGKVCLKLTTTWSLFGPDVLGVCSHVFPEGDFQPHEGLSSQSLGENTTLAPGRVSRLVSHTLSCSVHPLASRGSTPPSPLRTRLLLCV